MILFERPFPSALGSCPSGNVGFNGFGVLGFQGSFEMKEAWFRLMMRISQGFSRSKDTERR